MCDWKVRKRETDWQIHRNHKWGDIAVELHQQKCLFLPHCPSPCPTSILLYLFILSSLFCTVDRCDGGTPSFFTADVIKRIRRFLPPLPLPLSPCIPFFICPLSLQRRWLFFLIAILIIINQLTAGHERGPLSVLSFPFCILHSLNLSPPPILNHRLLSLSHHTFPVICLPHCLLL